MKENNDIINGCVLSFMYGEWCVLLMQYSEERWTMPYADFSPMTDDPRWKLQEMMADRFAMCIPADDWKPSALSDYCKLMVAYINPTGTEFGPDWIFDDLCKKKLRWIPVSQVGKFCNGTEANIIRHELESQNPLVKLWHFLRSKVKKPLAV